MSYKKLDFVKLCETVDEEVPLSFLIHIAENLFTPIFMKFHDVLGVHKENVKRGVRKRISNFYKRI